MSKGKYVIIAVLIVGIAVLGCWFVWHAAPSSLDNTGVGKKVGMVGSGKQPQKNESNDSLGLSAEEERTLRTWLKRDRSRQNAVEVGGICLRHRLSRDRIVDLVGYPTFLYSNAAIAYNYAPSAVLKFSFDEKGNLVSVTETGRPVNVDGKIETQEKRSTPEDRK